MFYKIKTFVYKNKNPHSGFIYYLYNKFFILNFFVFMVSFDCSAARSDPAQLSSVSDQKREAYQATEAGSLLNAQAILSDPLLPKIVEHVREKYGVYTVILHGSRARGTATLKSDYNIIGLQKSGKEEKHQEVFKDAYLDISIYPQVLQEDDLLHFSFAFLWLDAAILYQHHQEGEQFLDSLKKAFALHEKGSPEIKKIKTNALFVNLSRSHDNMVEKLFYQNRFLLRALQEYFPIHHLLYMGPKKSLEWLKTHDPVVFEAFSKALSPYASQKDHRDLFLKITGSDLDLNIQRSMDFKDEKKYIISEDKMLSNIISYIKEKYDVHTLILFGSRAKTTATFKSDYDFFAFGNPGIQRRDFTDSFKDVYLDIHLLSEETLRDMSSIRMFSPAKNNMIILYQKDQIGEKFIHLLQEKYNEGFFPSQEIKKKIVDRVYSTLEKIENNLIGQYYHHSLLYGLLEHYCTLRNIYYLGPRDSLQWLKENDLPTYMAYEKALKPGADVESLKELVKLVIPKSVDSRGDE